jgi:hypothetical protein
LPYERAAHSRLVSTDRLRLEVTVAERGEIFSWAAASRFEDASIDRVVTSGAIGSGIFSGFLDAVFHASKLTFLRTVNVGGRNLMEYSFQVAEADSPYRVKLVLAGNDWAKTAFSGTVGIDSESADVVSLTAQTAELPPAAGSCRTLTSIDFGKVDVGGFQLVLPKVARQRFLNRDRQETENTVTFSGCREYHAESTITFDDPDQGTKPSTQEKSELPVVPTDLRFTLELTTPIDFNSAAAGDSFTAKLAAPLVDASGKRLAPKGTEVRGRLMRVEFRVSSADVVLMLKPEIIEIPGAPARLIASRDGPGEDDRKQQHREVLFRRPGEEDSGGFIFKSAAAGVPRGFRSAWRTLLPAGSVTPTGVTKSDSSKKGPLPDGPTNLGFKK